MKSIIGTLVLASAMTSGLVYAQHQHGTTESQTAPRSDSSQRFAPQMDAGMKKMMNDMHAAGYTGNPDVDFLAMMIPHHEGAVEMARLALIHGKDPLTRRLAEEIIASQTAEIAAMKQHIAILRRTDDPNPDGFPAIHGKTRRVRAVRLCSQARALTSQAGKVVEGVVLVYGIEEAKPSERMSNVGGVQQSGSKSNRKVVEYPTQMPVRTHPARIQFRNTSAYRTRQEYSDRQTERGMAPYLPIGPKPISLAGPESSSVIDVGLKCTTRRSNHTTLGAARLIHRQLRQSANLRKMHGL
jgi:hypothetical protein